MVTKAQVNYIKSLARHKERLEAESYVVEGHKLALEWLASSSPIKMLFATHNWILSHQELIHQHPEAELIAVNENELERLSAMQSPNQVLLVATLPRNEKRPAIQKEGWQLALHDVQDPGNMGTLIRIADWFGIHHIIASQACADAFSPKVIQAAMGGQLRVEVQVGDLELYLSNSKMPILAATLDGDSIYQYIPTQPAILLIGNEGQGLTKALQDLATSRITIPKLGAAESLNAGVSAGILLSHLMK